MSVDVIQNENFGAMTREANLPLDENGNRLLDPNVPEFAPRDESDIGKSPFVLGYGGPLGHVATIGFSTEAPRYHPAYRPDDERDIQF